MQINCSKMGNILIVQLDGEIDHHSSKVIREEIDNFIESFSSIHLIFNFEKVSFMDSSGIGVIMGRYNKIKQLGGKIIITGCNDYVDRILNMSGIYTITGKLDTVEKAVEAIKLNTVGEV